MQKGTKHDLLVAATYAAVLFLGILVGQNYRTDDRPVSQSQVILPLGGLDRSNKVQRTLDLISDSYVDSVDLDSLQNVVISEMVSRLDPHSDFLAPTRVIMQTQALEGNFEGIGVEYFLLNDTLLVVGLVPDGPAQRAGVKVGDRILAIDSEPIAGVQVTDRMLEEKIRGRKGSVLELSIARETLELPFPLKVTRDQYALSSVDVAYLIEPGIAYIRVSNFGPATVPDCVQALKRMEQEGMQQLILDLRGNRGGYLAAGIELAGLFLPAGDVIVYTEGQHTPRTPYYAREGGAFTEVGLAVLVDEESASSSEIVAGAIQDYDRGTIIGRRSFGKGLVQERFGFGDGSALNLTIARYYTPLGRSIQKPYGQGSDEKEGGILHEMYRTASGKVLYGGGGIMPDIEVGIDSTEFSTLYREIFNRGLVHEFVYSQLATGVPAFAIENFLSGYFLPDSEFAKFIEFVESRGFELSREDESRIQQRMTVEIEALLGRYYFGSDAYFKIKNRWDPMVRATLDYLKVTSAQTG